MDTTDKKALMSTDGLSYTAMFTKPFLPADPFWIRKITMCLHFLADLNICRVSGW